MAASGALNAGRHIRFSSLVFVGSAKKNRLKTGCLRSAKAFSIRNQSTMQVQDKNPRIFTAVCVQRSPVVTKMKSHLEVAYQKFQDQLELEHSALSEDEVQLEEFLQRKKKLKDDDDENMTIGIFEADRKEFEEEQEEEGKKFIPADRCTESDKVNDLRSLQRKLGETLILFVKKQKDSETWEALHAEVTNTNETLQQVASKSVSEICGTDLSVQFLNNAPIAVIKNYKNKGNKVFFYKVNYVTGCVSLGEEYSDHIWVTTEEMRDLVDQKYYNILKRFLS
ncbi:unnamed protein product [Porites lobata]|uniref:Large ribosomal subunit protein mL46 n=1 Tax=Porites lobata TaxID=104759 RepID=A0ABN8P6W2_9CNID|nr:unnamed protein product [Porites lobata]